jgi:hypothetical protein
MDGNERYEEYQLDAFDDIILWIKNGKIPAGKYAKMVKIRKEDNVKGKEIFKND